MRALTLIILMFCLTGPVQAGTFDHEHRTWSSLLDKHVTWVNQGVASQVDYRGFVQDQAALDGYLHTLSSVSRQQFDSWSRDQRLAFLINAYNAFTVKLVTSHYPLESIKEIGGLFGSPWKQAFIPLFEQTLSLDQIEHSLIREPGAFDEPRIHFAVNCASVGCPALRSEAFAASKLDEQLEDSQRRFLSDPSRNRFDATSGHFQVSKIFDWYGADFAKRWGSLENYLLQQAAPVMTTEHSRPTETQPKTEFLDYDWSLNELS
jgi:hypothetical protein